MNDYDEFKIWYTHKAPDESEVTMVDMAAMAWGAARATAPEGMAIVSAMADDAYQALQNELSVMQAAIESYETPAAALKALIDWHVAVATDPRVNGGMAIVPVDALNSIMELAGVALVYQPFGTKDRQHFHALMAIIEDKP